MRRWPLRVHRALALVLAPLVLVWFGSGVVMLFSGYPSLDEAERLASLPSLEVPADAVDPDHPALAALGTPRRLIMVDGRAAYAGKAADGRREARAAERPEQRLHPELEALRSALARSAGYPVELAERLEGPDQWTLSGSIQPHFPLARFRVLDPERSWIDLSLRTGERVQQSTRRERVLAWLGAIPHWIYPTALRRHREPWRLLVIALALATCAMSVAGLIWGVQLTRARAARRQRRWTPLRERWQRWHHLLGLAAGALTLSWGLSGAFSLNPLRWSPGSSPSDEARAAVESGPPAQPAAVSVAQAWRRCREQIHVREIELRRFGGREYYLCRESPQRTRLVVRDDPGAALLSHLPPEQVERGLHPLAQGAALQGGWLEEPDAYYYPTHFRPLRRFPVYRVILEDGEQTRLYFDAHEARLLHSYGARARAERWLYHGLHSWDFAWLYQRPVLWRAALLVLLALGFLLSFTGVWIGARRLRRRLRSARPSRTAYERAQRTRALAGAGGGRTRTP